MFVYYLQFTKLYDNVVGNDKKKINDDNGYDDDTSKMDNLLNFLLSTYFVRESLTSGN